MRSDQGSDASAMTRLNDPMPAEQIQRLLHDKLGATVSIMDVTFKYVNAGFAQAFDLPAQALIGRNVREFYSESDFAEFSPHLQRAFAGETVAYERVGRLRDRHAIWRTVSLVPWRDETDGRVLGAVMSSLPVHELMVATESLRAANARLSSHMDNSPLTVFELQAALNRANRNQAVVAVLYLDLDGFKMVNDTFGHASGDQVLQEVAQRLKKAVRDTDTLARIGGDEFAVLLDTEVHADTAQAVCDRILGLLAQDCVFDTGQARIGASIGVAQHPPMPSQVEALLARADAAMYAAKRAGKGRVHHAD